MGTIRVRRRRSERGQAAVEAALTLPLAIFMILGALQLFMMMQGRIMAQYAVAQAGRVGARNHGACTPMVHAAVLSLLPSFRTFVTAAGSPGAQLVAEFQARANGRYTANDQTAFRGAGSLAGHPIVWINRARPQRGDILPGNLEEETFDLMPPDVPRPRTLELQMVYFYPMRIPFANWLFARIAAANWSLEEYRGANPVMYADRDAEWTSTGANIGGLQRAQFWTAFQSGQYVMPIRVTYVTRMMTPARAQLFAQQHCDPAPGGPL